MTKMVNYRPRSDVFVSNANSFFELPGIARVFCCKEIRAVNFGDSDYGGGVHSLSRFIIKHTIPIDNLFDRIRGQIEFVR